MKKRVILFIITTMITLMLTACFPAKSALQPAEVNSGAPPAVEFSTAEEAVQKIKEVKSAGPEKMAHANDFKLFEKEHIYLLKECPIPGFEQSSIMLTIPGTTIVFQNNEKSALFTSKTGYGYDERIANVTDEYDLKRYEDSKFFFGKKNVTNYMFWWENGDLFYFAYPADVNISPEEIIKNIEVVKYDLKF